MKKLLYILPLFVVGFIACEEAEDVRSALTDIYIESKVIENDTVFALAYVCQANIAIESVNVANIAQSSELELTAYDKYNTTFVKFANDSEFQSEVATNGVFVFTTKFTDQTEAIRNEVLSGDIIYPAKIDQEATLWNDQKNQFEFEWNDVAGFSYYALRLYDDTGLRVYASHLIRGASSYQVKLPENDDYWLEDYEPQEGATYTVEVAAYRAEDLNREKLEAMSQTSSTIVWNTESSEE